MRRMSMSLGVESLDDVGARITELLEMKVPEGLIGKLAMLPRLLEVGKFPPRMRRGDAPCQEIVWRGDEVNLDKLPLIKCWPEDGGNYITFPMVITRDPKRGIRNVGMYRVMQTGRRRRSPCTGSGTKSARRTGARWRSAARRCRSASRSAPIRRRCIRRARRFRRRSTSFCSRDFCGSRRSR